MNYIISQVNFSLSNNSSNNTKNWDPDIYCCQYSGFSLAAYKIYGMVQHFTLYFADSQLIIIYCYIADICLPDFYCCILYYLLLPSTFYCYFLHYLLLPSRFLLLHSLLFTFAFQIFIAAFSIIYYLKSHSTVIQVHYLNKWLLEILCQDILVISQYFF